MKDVIVDKKKKRLSHFIANEREFLTMTVAMRSKYKLNIQEICLYLIVSYMVKREQEERAWRSIYSNISWSDENENFIKIE